MSGIYIHIPFCKKACHYCNFHFSTQMDLKPKLIKALLKEIELQKDYLDGDKIQTIYFGGGTPSVLSEKELEEIFSAIHKYHNVSIDAEITLEANPDDLTMATLMVLKNNRVNRLSIGVQSFVDKELDWMNRSHNAIQASQSIQDAQSIGITDISIDLIFGSPVSTYESWRGNILQAIAFNVPHISCYGLTVEPKTALEKMIQLGKMEAPNENAFEEQFFETIEILQSNGYDHYEISNYAKNNKYSQHNTNYWKQKKYLGLGPSAHSFNLNSRQWNIKNNPQYIQNIENGNLPFEIEKLSETDILNEYLMTGLRTMWGCEWSRFEKLDYKIKNKLQKDLFEWEQQGKILSTNKSFSLTKKGKIISDHIISSLFIDHVQ